MPPTDTTTDSTVTAEQADFILDWLEADMDDALAACEVPDENGETIYQRSGDADAKTFISSLIDVLEPIATPVEAAEGDDGGDDAEVQE